MVVAFLNDAPPADPDAGQPREVGVAQTVAKKAEYELKVSQTSHLAEGLSLGSVADICRVVLQLLCLTTLV